uniref:Bestrophin homolog n=1 Tax=Heterorhabditis bacteriophora TaxID=37862 RepID=A0A1I7XGQ1_HETBA
MTVSYNLDVSSVSSFSFFKLLFRWKGSIWKFVIKELVAWLFGFYAIFCLYRYILTPDQKRLFERIAENCDRELDYIPLTFLLGFFVTIIIDRWRQIFNNMGWIEKSVMTL